MRKMVYFLFALFLANVTFAQTVEFRVNMSIKAKKAQFNPATDSVWVAGNFNEWSNSADLLTDLDNDSIYTVTKTLTVGQELAFKFVKASAKNWEDAIQNRVLTVTEGTTVYTAYFDNDSVYSAPKPIVVTFSANMEFELVSGRFSPATDTLTIRGSQNGWASSDILAVSTTDPNFYEFTDTITLGVGEKVNYKFAYHGPRGTTWEGDPNKVFELTQADYDFGEAFSTRTFNDLTLETVTNYPISLRFVVDMNGAVSGSTASLGQAFPSINNVAIAGANAPLQWPGAGWPDADSIVIHKMFDDGTNGDAVAGDKFYTITLEFPQYSPFRIQYKYGANWGLASNLGSNDNENGVGADHFIMLSSTMLSATVNNVFGTMGDHTLENVVLSGVQDLGTGIPANYSLEQNYPNPFNPTTNIRFNLTETGLVTLKVYNALGQEISTLLNEVKNPGSYQVDFNAAGLTSGIYFYKIQSNNFTSTKKMVILK